MKVVFGTAMLVMFADPRYQVVVGAGAALLLTTHLTSSWVSSCIVSGLVRGINVTFWISTVNKLDDTADVINAYVIGVYIYMVDKNYFGANMS